MPTALQRFVPKEALLGLLLMGAMIIASLPERVSWVQIYGVALLCGIGFTMSLFVGSLAFEQSGGGVKLFDERLGILVGSLLSAAAGTLVLRYFSKSRPPSPDQPSA